MSARPVLRSQDLGGEELERVAEMFKALSDPTRLRILSVLGGGEACVHDLCARIGMSQPAVSHQLRLLRVGRLVKGRRRGREVIYSLDDRHVMELIGAARSHAGHAKGGKR
jgi:ArsR family transcriptional regulator, lead/cadmium/zinc/bismuth-responsive transcriptional repressor